MSWKVVDIEKIKNVYFIGIGGIGMSALALYFQRKGCSVSGYDKVPSIVTGMLEAQDIPVHFEEKPDILQALNKKETLVVYTPAVPSQHKELLLAFDSGYPVMKRAEVLGLISGAYRTIAVAGTHGKTTVTSMIAHIFKIAGKKSVVFTGGLMSNYDTNFLYDDDAEYMIVEADEYDRSFLNFDRIYIEAVTAVDADHLDIYGTYANLTDAFKKFAGRVQDEGVLVVNEKYAALFDTANERIYGFDAGKYRAVNVSVRDFKFDLEVAGQVMMEGISLKVAGVHNIENAVAASAVALEAGIDEKRVRKALETFKGNWRRFEIVYNDDDVVYIDDYAHHPREIESVLKSVREIWQGKKVTVVFQPHLYTRTRDFADEFAKVLSEADEVVLLPIYPARELPLPGISSEWLASRIGKEVPVVEKSEIAEFLRNGSHEIIITLGAGDIDREVKKIKRMLEEKYAK